MSETIKMNRRKSRSKVWVKTVPKLNAALCQNQTLVKLNPTPKTKSPTNDDAMSGTTTAHAFQ